MKTSFAGRWTGWAVVAVVASGGCASTQVLTQGEVGRSGARAFAAPRGTMFAVTVGALTAEGYEIASSDVASGLIVTKPLAVHTPGRVTARAYRVTLTPNGQGTRVVAQPILYAGARDISDADAWTLDGPEGERAQWSDLFGVMDAALAAPVAAPNSDEAVAAGGAGAPPLAKAQAAPGSPAVPGDARSGVLTPARLSAPPGSGGAGSQP